MNTTMTIEDSINALKHIADDHNCCAFTLDGVMEAVEKLQAENARLRAELKKDYDEFEHLAEHWNGSHSSAVTASEHICASCEAAIERLKEGWK